ncbi:MAG: ABC transporter ATP-binding protein [Clostridia bacterium]|nr:ABC transporter ATP-binding protein [Clostridia bacterium]
MDGLLEVDGLVKRFGKTQVLHGVSFSVQKGEVFGLVGESGCGKTTVGRTVLGLYPADGGSVRFDGRETVGIKGRERKAFAHRAQMIFQDPIASLNPRMTVKEILSEGLLVHGEKRGKLVDEKVERALSSVGLPKTALGRYPHEFSGGQRQRIGIARAIVLEPEFIIADEPVSALDVSVQAQVINLLSDLKRDLGLTVLFVAHDLSVVKYFCDRVAVMYAGQIVEIAPSKKLFEKPKHAYTKSLLSAIPLPDPRRAKRMRRIPFEEKIGENIGAGTHLTQVCEGHFVRKGAEGKD